MPEKDISTYQMLAAVGTSLVTAIAFFIGMVKSENKKLDSIVRDIREIEDDLHEFREHVAVVYPSHKAMQACSDNITKSMNQGFKTQAAELKLAMRDVVASDCPHCAPKK